MSWRWSQRCRCAGSCGASSRRPATGTGSGWSAGSSTSCRWPTIPPAWSWPARPSPRRRDMAARPAWPRWSGCAGPAAGWSSSGRTTSAGSPPAATGTSASPGRCPWSSAAMTRPWSWPRSSTPRRPPRYGDAASRAFPLRSWASTRRATWPVRCCPNEDGPHEDGPHDGPREDGTVKIAIMAPLVTAIREPQRGGSQAFVSDLARGLAGRGHDVHVYAATGSEIPGVQVIDTGIDPESLAGTFYRASGSSAAEPAAAAVAESAFTTAYTAMQAIRYDVIHNHAFDAPAVRLAAALPAPVVHTVHLPPDTAVSAALRLLVRGNRPPAVA